MKFLVYSEVNADTIAANLGQSEYSYYFVLKEFLPVLRQLGDVQVVKDPLREVDALYADRAAWAERALRNIAGMGRFSVDRTITEYVDRVWRPSAPRA